jgi:hypothetical protein
LSLISNNFDETDLEDFQSHFAGHRTKAHGCVQGRKDTLQRDVRLVRLNHFQPRPFELNIRAAGHNFSGGLKSAGSLYGWLSARPAKTVSEMNDH